MIRISLHPSMTAAQISEWCHKHHMVVTIRWIARRPGAAAPYIIASAEPGSTAALPSNGAPLISSQREERQ